MISNWKNFPFENYTFSTGSDVILEIREFHFEYLIFWPDVTSYLKYVISVLVSHLPTGGDLIPQIRHVRFENWITFRIDVFPVRLQKSKYSVSKFHSHDYDVNLITIPIKFIFYLIASRIFLWILFSRDGAEQLKIRVLITYLWGWPGLFLREREKRSRTDFGAEAAVRVTCVMAS